MRRLLPVLIAAVALAVAAAPASANRAKHIDHTVVVFEEIHSFDNLYGGWEGVTGLSSADAAHTTQVAQGDGRTPYSCLLQNDVNLTSPPLDTACDATSHFANAPFKIEDYIPRTAKTCPAPGVFAAHGIQDPTGLPGG